MPGSTVIHPGSPTSSVRYIRIRDHILIDAALKSKFEALPASITLVAREIEHAPGIDLKLPGREIIIVADHYDAKGRTIDVSGDDAKKVANGATGANGLATSNFNRPGGPGTKGTPGADGADAGSIRIVVQRLGDVPHSWPTAVRAARAATGATVATAVPVAQDPAYRWVPGLNWRGRRGGQWRGRRQGRPCRRQFTAAGVPPSPLLIQVDAGPSGAAGLGGLGGVSGSPFGAGAQRARTRGPARCSRRPPARTGSSRSARRRSGRTRRREWAPSTPSHGRRTAFSSACTSTGNSSPASPDSQDRLRLASTEFDAVLRLQPGNADAVRHNRQIELRHDVLGFPENLDLDPRFDEYLSHFVSFASFITNFYNQGISLILAGQAESVAGLLLAFDEGRIATEIAFSMSDLAAAETGIKAAKTADDDVEARLSLINERIKVAAAAKPNEGISIGTVFATVGTVAAAVGSVIAAVPTAGASLFALVPSLAGLAVQVLNDIGGHIFEATAAEKDALKAEYETVGKNVDNVVKGVKAVVNLVEAIKLLTEGKTAGNAEVVDLIEQGVELLRTSCSSPSSASNRRN